MRITAIHLHHLSAPLAHRIGWSLNWADRRNGLIVEVQTDAGLTGWGDGGGSYDTLRARPDLFLGRNPLELAALHDVLREPPRQQRRTGPMLAGGLDTALWDIAAQAAGLPLHRLLGLAQRTSIQPYCTALYRKEWPDLAGALAAEAAEWKRRGFRIIKMKIGFGVETDTRIVAAVRAAIGPDTGLAVDSNCAYDAGTAVRLSRLLEPYDLMWWEEPVLADDFDGYARLRAATRIPLAGGETGDLDTLTRDYVSRQLVDIVQPEVEIVGITGLQRLAYLCWLHRVRLVPHNWGTAIRTAAILHAMAVMPPITEGIYAAPPALFEFDRSEHPFRDAVVADAIVPGPDGMIPVPTRPGLGVTVVPEAVAAFRVHLEKFR
ncbi:MAG: mandelate racemase/muconate lactonizing enzyme family protein [Bryobacterales bacterium]|nr:mandelate racemase/muconate lactonizing enzyme family protein [Bryobacterales bacterium]